LGISYRGGNPTERPERLKSLKDGDYPSLREVSEYFGAFVERVYNEEPHQGQGMDGRSPREVYDSLLVEKRTAKAEHLRLMLMKTTRPMKVQRQGVRVSELGGLWYKADELHLLQGQEVFARYDLNEAGQVLIFDLEDRYICEAVNRQAFTAQATAEDFRELSREKKRLRKITAAYRADEAERREEPDPLRRLLEKKRRNEPEHESPPPAKVIRVVPGGIKNIDAAVNRRNLAAQEKAERQEISEKALARWNTRTPGADSEKESLRKLYANLGLGG
jgi:putative transposase